LDEDKIDKETLLTAVSGRGLKSNRATTNPPLKSSDFLQETDKKVKEIIKQILQAQKETPDCGVSIKTSIGESVTLSEAVTPVQLGRVRQQFTTYLRNLPTAKNSDEAVSLFLQFLVNPGNTLS